MSDPVKKHRGNSLEMDQSDLKELFTIKVELTNLINDYIQHKIDFKLKSYYESLSVELTNKIIDEIDKSTSKVIEKIVK